MPPIIEIDSVPPMVDINSLPQELVDQVIDCLHDNISSLKHCSTVCRSWTSAACTHLFSTFSLRLRPTGHSGADPRNGVSVDLAAGFFAAHPRVASKVQELHLFPADRSHAPKHGLCIHANFVYSILEQLGNIRALMLDGLQIGPNIPTLEPHAISTMKTSKSKLSKLMFKAVKVLHITYLTSVLNLFDEITHLHFIWLCYCDMPIEPLLAENNCLRVKKLLFEDTSPGELFKALTSLHSCVNWGTVEVSQFTTLLLDAMLPVNNFLGMMSNLQDLTLDIPDRWYSWEIAERSIETLYNIMKLPSLSTCAQLQTIDIIIPIKMSPVDWDRINSFVWDRVMEMLHQIPEPRTIRLNIGRRASYAFIIAPYVLAALETVDWSRLDQVVEQKPTLTRLEITAGCRRPRSADIHRAIKAKLSKRTRMLLRLYT